jgi:hypothetical protein
MNTITIKSHKTNYTDSMPFILPSVTSRQDTSDLMDYCNPYWQPIWYPPHPQWQVDNNFSRILSMKNQRLSAFYTE